MKGEMDGVGTGDLGFFTVREQNEEILLLHPKVDALPVEIAAQEPNFAVSLLRTSYTTRTHANSSDGQAAARERQLFDPKQTLLLICQRAAIASPA